MKITGTYLMRNTYRKSLVALSLTATPLLTMVAGEKATESSIRRGQSMLRKSANQNFRKQLSSDRPDYASSGSTTDSRVQNAGVNIFSETSASWTLGYTTSLPNGHANNFRFGEL
jgi:hypothetical protein